MNQSLRDGLTRIGETRPNKSASFRIPDNFHSFPPDGSLFAAVRSMKSLRTSNWRQTSHGRFFNLDWTEACQGVTYDGRFWYFSRNFGPGGLKRKQGIYKLKPNMEQEEFFSVKFLGHDHLGDIDYYNGKIIGLNTSEGLIFAAMEGPEAILVVPTDFHFHSLVTLKGRTIHEPSPQGDSLPWCAINPWNGYLYSSRFGQHKSIDKVFAYSFPDLTWKATLGLKKPIRHVQGGCFTHNGHLLLTSDHSHDIRCYSALNGGFLGSVPIEVNDSASVREEVEGLTIRKDFASEGRPAEVHVVLLDNDLTSRDDVYFKHYSVPNPDDL